MAQAKSVSLKHFTSAVQSAVKAAALKHPKLKLELPEAVTLGYLIRGYPVPETLLADVTLAETQAVATEIAAHLATQGVAVEAREAKVGGHVAGAVLSYGGHIILGYPAFDHFTLEP